MTVQTQTFGRWAEYLVRLVSVLVALAIVDFLVLRVSHWVLHDHIFAYDSVLGWKLKSNLVDARKPYRVDTDVHGFRIRPDDPRDNQQFDMILLGDSFAFGSGAEVGDTLFGLLRASHPSLAIADTGVPGYGTDQEYLMLERYAPLLKPGGTVVLLTYINDFEDVRLHGIEVAEKPWFDFDRGELRIHTPHSLLNWIRWHWTTLYVIEYMAWEARGAPKWRVYGDDALAASLYDGFVTRMARIVHEHRGQFIAVYLSGEEVTSANARLWYAAARDAATHADVPFISLDDDAAMARRDLYILGDIHWNPAGVRAAYDYLAPRLFGSPPQSRGHSGGASYPGRGP
jgi:hypothetical protein